MKRQVAGSAEYLRPTGSRRIPQAWFGKSDQVHVGATRPLTLTSVRRAARAGRDAIRPSPPARPTRDALVRDDSSASSSPRCDPEFEVGLIDQAQLP